MPTVAARTARFACALALAVLGVAATLIALPTGPAPGGTRAAGWTGLLEQAHDLGPSRAATAEVLVALRAPRRPASLLGWAARHGLRATWFRGQPTALLAARPAVLGRALGVRIDDFRLPGYRVFYASRRAGQVPAPLNAEVATVSRITSFGQVQSVGDPPGPATGGLAPGGFLNAYEVRPLWQHGDLGQGETIVFFEVDGYHPADLAAYAARFGLPRMADPLPHIGPLNAKVLGESDMDLEVAHAIAPDATLVYVNLAAFGGKNSSLAAQFVRAFSTVAQQYPGAIWSASLGLCEDIFSRSDAAAVNNAVQVAEQAGTSAFVASGDSGGLECLGLHSRDPRIPAAGISFPGDLPQVTTVGGTALQLTTAGQVLGTAAWTEPLLSQGSTGGPSTLFSQLPWQRAPGVISPYSDGSPCGQPAAGTAARYPTCPRTPRRPAVRRSGWTGGGSVRAGRRSQRRCGRR